MVDLQTGTSEDILMLYRSCIRDISRPQWSHNGRYLAFVAEDGRSPGEVYTVDVATRAVFRLTDLQQTSNGLFSTPTWSPDDTFLATAYNLYERVHMSRVIVVSTDTTKGMPVHCS